MTDLNRRKFVKLAVLGGVGLVLRLPHPLAAEPRRSSSLLTPLIRVGADGRIALFAQNPEMGQGVKTALPMMIAEELGVDWSSIDVEQAEWDSRLENQFSGGSLSVRLNFAAMRQAGASARAMLMQAAANQWGQSITELTTVSGSVLHDSTNRKLSYGELAEAASLLPVPDDSALKPTAEFNVIGQSVSDVDLHDIVIGAQKLSLDRKLPGMLYAVVRRSPYSDGQPVSFDNSDALKLNGVVGFEMLRNDQHGGRIALPNSPNFVSGIAVLAEHTWAAMEAARRLKVDWEKPDPLPDSARLMTVFERSIENAGEIIRTRGSRHARADPRISTAGIASHFRQVTFNATHPHAGTTFIHVLRIFHWLQRQAPVLAFPYRLRAVALKLT